MPAKTDPQWFRGKFGQLAYELEEARRQEVKPLHLMIRATRASIQAARLVIEGVNAGIFNRWPKLRENLRFTWTGKIKCSGGTVTVDEHYRLHFQLIADVPEVYGALLPIETASDEQLARLWVFPIFGVVKTLQPSSFKANAGAYDWKTIRKDDQGPILGRDGKPLKYVQETLTDPDTGEPVYTWRLSGEPTYVGDNYDEVDLVWHSRARVGDWADTCRVLADLIAESETGANRGNALPDGQEGESPSGERIDPTRGQRPTKQRTKRQVSEPLIAQHLIQRPHDTAAQVAEVAGCSVGVVAESKAWKLNQRRLKVAKQHGIDPKAVKLDERAVNAVGGGKMRQLHDSRQHTDGINDKLDKAEQVLFQRIGVYETQHPQATPEQVASAIGCTAGDVERRQAILNRLVAEQGEDHLEDVDVEDPDARRGKRRKWVPKRV